MTTASHSNRGWWLLATLVGVALIFVLTILNSGQVQALLTALKPPVLPPAQSVEQIRLGDQGWDDAVQDRYHHQSQGTRTIPMPVEWFMALEQPAESLISGVLFSEAPLFSSPTYMSRLGFIPGRESEWNPHELPIGFATSSFQEIPGLDGRHTALGMTCAACHTGQLVFEGNRYVIDGGPAVTDLGQLTKAIGAALGQTALSAQLPLFNGRFDRFAKRVLGENYDPATRFALSQQLTALLGHLATQPAGIDVIEGYSRLDALNRIGNQVFAIDSERPFNYAPIDAPVNYPHIWTASWFDWVQYDASIMQPLIRNAGEAMGVSAHTSFDAMPLSARFATDIPMRNLHWIETSLAGETPPTPTTGISGLQAPSWPAAFGEIDAELANRGAQLYYNHCAHCHRPALTPEVAAGNAPDSAFWKYWSPIVWTDGDGNPQSTAESYLTVHTVPQPRIGTDPAQGAILEERTVDTAASALRAGSSPMGINQSVCAPTQSGLAYVEIEDSPTQSFALALGAVVQKAIDQWMAVNLQSPEQRLELEGDRPNCLQKGAGYKARPLNGVWATAPFLHNGSIASIEQLLGPVEDRAERIKLGDATFDPESLGLANWETNASTAYDEDGYFVLDTNIPGNSNRGHEFRDGGPRAGRVGKALSAEDRAAIIEFLKTL